jgi:hypothetical protein
MTDDQWRYWEQVAELAAYMLVDADRNFASL